MKSIPEEKVIERLRVENPWWQPPHQVDAFFAKMTRRAYFRLFADLVIHSEVRRAVVLMGPRRVGKTVLIHHAVQELLETGTAPTRVAYVSIDHPLYNALSLDDLLELIAKASGGQQPLFVFFDEIQYLREWERHLKSIVDTHKGIRFVASGSAAAALRLKSIESGAGRFTNFLLPPLSFHEYLMLKSEDALVTLGVDGWAATDDIDRVNSHFVDYLNYGGYPEALFSSEIRQDPGRFIKGDIVDKVLLRDLPSLYGIQDIQELNSLFTTLAYNTASEVSLEHLSQSSGVAKNTIKRYIEYLEAAFLVRRVTRVDRNARRFKRQPAFKVYLANPSMRAALFAPISADDPDAGSLVETGMYAQWFHGEDFAHHYARWDNAEIDMVSLEVDGKPGWVAEAKWTDRFVDNPNKLGAVLRFCRSHGVNDPVVTTRSAARVVTMDKVRIEFVPAALYCYTVGSNVSAGRRLQFEHWLARK